MQLFDFIIESKKVGVRKPNNKFYELALSETKVAPEKTIFLDDLGINLKPARKLNISTAYLYGKLEPQDTVYCYVPKYVEYFNGTTQIPAKLVEEFKRMTPKERKSACKPDRSKVIEIYR